MAKQTNVSKLHLRNVPLFAVLTENQLAVHDTGEACRQNNDMGHSDLLCVRKMRA
jgi:hypothetical protein